MKYTKSELKVLIIIMTCGEPQNTRCIASAKNQCGIDCDVHLIQDKNNVEAHRELYETINSKSGYDYFVKLDGDMEFSSEGSMQKILSNMGACIDHLTIPVFDYMTMDDMPELHVFSSRTKVIFDCIDELFVDKVTYQFPGEKSKLDESSKLVLHCKNPNHSQAAAFGFHRAMKLMQKDRYIPAISATRYHYNTLRKVFNYWEKTNSKIHFTVLTAALNVVCGKDYIKMSSKKSYSNEKIRQFSEDEIRKFFLKNSFIKSLELFGLFRFVLGMIVYFHVKFFRLIFRRVY